MTDYGTYTASEGTNGAAVTTGTAFDVITGTFIYSTTGASHAGALGYRAQQATAANWRAYKTLASATQLACRIGFTFNTLTPTRDIVWIVNAAFGSNARFGVDAANHPVIKNSAGTVLATGAAALTAGTPYAVEIQTAPGTSTSDGTIKCQLYAISSPTTLLLTYTATNVNAGAGSAIIRGQVGQNSSETIDVTFDDILWRTGTLTAVGYYQAQPTANAGPAQTSVEPYATVTLDGSGSTAVSPAGIASYAWTQTSGPTVTLSSSSAAAPTFTAPAVLAGATLVFSLTVTDTASSSSTASTVSVTVLPHTVWRLDASGVLHALRLTRI